MFIIVYKTINKINNKEYIGVHTLHNFNDNYLGSGILLKKAINKYGKENFERKILKIFNNIKEAYKFEEFIVNQKYINKSNTYNLKTGGLGSINYTEEMKNKASEKLGHKVVVIKENKVLYFKSIIKASEYLNVNKQSIYPILHKRGNCSTVKGYNICYLKDYYKDITFKKVNKGKPKFKVEKLDKNNNSIKIYNCLSDAAKDNNTKNKLISACINGRSKTCAGYKWKKYKK